MKELYSVKDVARLFEMREARVRYWAQTGVVSPSVRKNGRHYYKFQDLLSIKVAKELIEAGISLQRVRKNLDALRTALPQNGRPLASMRICSDGDRVVVVDDDIVYEPDSGQLVLSFTVGGFSTEVADVFPLAAKQTPPIGGSTASAYDQFCSGLVADDSGDCETAEAHYRQAVALDENCAAAWTNLGNLLAQRSKRGEAREAYERAVLLDPELPEARYNLANLLSDLQETELAQAEYQRVLLGSPSFADAHFNLGLLHFRSDTPAQAGAHLDHYLALDPTSEWADQARTMLQALR